VLHPSFLDQVFLNRHNDSGDIPLLTSAESIDVPKKNGAWYAPVAGIKDADGDPITPESNHRLVIVRMGIKKNALNDAGKFTLAQLRLICKKKSDTKGPLVGKGINVYPIGYISGENRIQTKRLSELITVSRDDFGQEAIRYIDFAFGVPNDHAPVLLEFKLNNIVEVPRPVSEEQAPAPLPFVERSRTGNEPTARNESSASGPPNQDRRPPRRRGLSDTSRSIVGDGFDE
jgi:hypothetical protein